jgi:hypothetical protein
MTKPLGPTLDALPFRVEEWDAGGHHVVDLVAACSNMLVAEAAFDAVALLRPTAPLRLRNRARVIRRINCAD